MEAPQAWTRAWGNAFAPHSRYAICASHNTLEEHDELQFEEDDGIDGRTATACVGLLNKLTHKREIDRSFEMAIEVIGWH